MKGAKCFIEVWRSEYGRIWNSDYNDISELPKYLESSKKNGIKTIAVWFIKPKVKPH